MKSQKIRDTFTQFFIDKGHTQVPSSSLIPGNDPTLLFTNSGMVQFKDVFLGLDKRPYSRATTVQKCIRAGGKHNDLENVGFTARHHTFFEMLGNFSFGDYFKQDAIHYAWELLTEVFNIPAERLWITVFEEDHEAEKIWLNEIGISPKRMSRIGAKDNFWSMGDTGPCGPCTEIFYDHGPHIPGGPPGSPDDDKDRYVEIWNLVFMQYNRDIDGKLTPLPKPSVDTGSGLERIAAVLQGVHENYDIDTFKYLIEKAAKVLKCEDLQSRSLRIIADHIRASTFLIADGILPGNEGRGYVLRRIMRRAMRQGYKLGSADLFFHKLVKDVTHEMGQAYPEIVAKQKMIEQAIKQEEEQFAKTLSQGSGLFEDAIKNLTAKIIPGEVVFKLYDTYGFPIDLTADMARERGLNIDEAGFEVCMNEQRDRARASNKFKIDYNSLPKLECKSEFLGYESLNQDSKVLVLLSGGIEVKTLEAGQYGQVVLAKSPFYPEGGGQIGDAGVLRSKTAEFKVIDTQKQNNAIIHVGEMLKGSFNVGEILSAEVDMLKRMNTMRNHSATHLLHAALRTVLGEHVEQKGSLVAPSNLRFDFSHPKPMTVDEKQKVEQWVNEAIALNLHVETLVTSLENAKKLGAMALFGEKYGDTVRVLKMGNHSIEFCGGTHVTHTGDIGLFKITSESGIASGIRRIEGLTSMAAKAYLEDALSQASSDVNALREQAKQLEKQLTELKTKWVLSTLPAKLIAHAESIKGHKVLISEVNDLEPAMLMPLVNELKNQIQSGVVVLGLPLTDKVQLIVGITQDLTSIIKAGDLVNELASQLGGKGGGRPELAQAGGTEVAKLPHVLKAAKALIKLGS